jgi:hypothetical protein
MWTGVPSNMALQQASAFPQLPDNPFSIPRRSSLGKWIADAMALEPKRITDTYYTAPYLSFRRIGLTSPMSLKFDYEFQIVASNERIVPKFYSCHTQSSKRIGIKVVQCRAFPDGVIIYHPISPDQNQFRFWRGEALEHSLEIPVEDLIKRWPSNRSVCIKLSTGIQTRNQIDLSMYKLVVAGLLRVSILTETSSR